MIVISGLWFRLMCMYMKQKLRFGRVSLIVLFDSSNNENRRVYIVYTYRYMCVMLGLMV